MAKNSKNQDSNGATEATAAEAAPAAKKRSKSAAKKSGSNPGTKKKTRKPATKKSKGYEPSDDEIRLRAYFLAERRVQMSMEGDAANDWLEARQQLLEEAAQRKAAAPSAPE